MKRVFSILLALIMLLSAMPLTAFAETGPVIKFETTAPETPKVGDKFTVTASINENPGVAAILFKLDWNTDALRFEGFTTIYDEEDEEDVLKTDVLGNFTLNVSNENASISGARAKNNTKTGLLFEANFAVVGEGDFNISLKTEKTDGKTNFMMNNAKDEVVEVSIDESALANLSCTAPNPDEPEGNPIQSVTVTHPNIEEEINDEGTKTLVMEMVVGVVEQLKLDITALLPGEDPTQTIVWNSSNPDVVKVDHVTGELTAKAAGVAYITATATDGTATALIDDENQPASATVKVTVKDVATDKFTVTLGSDVEVSAADDITIPVTVDHETENSTYNAYELVFTYNPEYLTLKNTNDNTDGKEFTVVDDNGTVTIRRYGDPLNAGKEAFDLEFTAEQTGTSNVKLTSANVGTSQHAQNIDVPEAQIQDNLTIVTVTGYNVQLPEDDFNGESVAAPDKDYTFEAKNKFYDYTFTVTVGGEPVENAVTDNGNGTYTIEKDKITGNIAIKKATEVGKKFDVTITGNGATQMQPVEGFTTGVDAAQYNTNYQVKLTSKGEGYSYEVVIKIGDSQEAYTCTPVDGVYTIAGTAITGDITITVAETEPTIENHNVTIQGSGKDDVVQGSAAETVAHNGNYTFQMDMEDGYDYIVTAVMGADNKDVTKTEEADDDGYYTYTVENVTADLVITIEKSNLEVEVVEYVKLKGNSSLFLVMATQTLPEGKTLAFDANTMYQKQFKNLETDELEWKFCYLVAVGSAETFTEENAIEMIAIVDGESVQLDVDYNVNGSSKTDINDAQLVYDMYKAVYGSDDLETVSVMKFLKGDLNGDRTINVSDAAAVVNEILNPTTGE